MFFVAPQTRAPGQERQINKPTDNQQRSQRGYKSGKSHFEVRDLGHSKTAKRRLRCARHHRAHKIDTVNRRRYAVQRCRLARQRRNPKRLGAGADQHRRPALFLRRQRKRQLHTRSLGDGNMRVKVDSRTGNISKLARVELKRPLPRQANLYRQIDFVPPRFSSFSHGYPRLAQLHSHGQPGRPQPHCKY